MKRVVTNFFFKTTALLWLFILSLGLFSCNGNQKDITPSADFAPYVKAYTGGVISKNSTIRIELTNALPMVETNSEIEKNPFRFSPSLKGKAYWINNSTIEFIPDKDELEAGTVYTTKFRLGDFLSVEKKLKEFTFTFRVQEHLFNMSVDPIKISASAPEIASITGEITFSDVIESSDVEKILSAKNGRKSYPIKVIPTNNALQYQFLVEQVKRESEAYSITISADGSAARIKQQSKMEISIPAKDNFCYLSAKRIDQPENGILVTFSDPISNTQDLKGLVEISELKNYVTQIEDNQIWVFFEAKQQEKLTLNLHEGIKNYQDKSLGSSHSVSFADMQLKPQVEIPSAAAILPDSKNLIIPFRAVNLYAVDLHVIRIYENNLPTYLQENNLSSANALRRAGRLVYKKTFWLDEMGKDIHQWQDYSIDLAGLIQQEPGALYRVLLTFRQEYSAYPCGGNSSESHYSDNNLMQVNSNISDEEDAVWDDPSTYYYYSGAQRDWSVFDWRERENPCHATYYMYESHFATCNVLASNIGMIVKRNSRNTLWVAVNNILDTKPIEKAKVTAYNFQLQTVGSGETNAEGMLEINTKGKPFLVIAEVEKQKAYVKVADGEEQSVSRFDVGGKEIEKGLKGFIYGERGIWRPGDTLHLSFILEDREKRIPDTHPVSLELYNPHGQFYTKMVSTKGVNGFHIFTLPTKSEDPTGVWNAYVKVGGSTFHKAIRIETIKPNRLKINLQLPTILRASQKETTASLSSAWLTGAKVSNLKAQMKMSLSKVNTQFKNFDQYIFNNPATDFTYTKKEVFYGTLDAEGNARVRLNLPEASQAPGMLNAQITTRVYEPGGDASLYTQTVPFSPFSSYVGINLNQPKGKYIETDKEHVFDVVTVDDNGNLTNRSNLEYKIYKIDWSWWWERGDKSFSSYVNSTSIVPVASGSLQTVGGKCSFMFKVNYPDWGRFLIYVKDKDSGHATGGTVRVDWPDWRGRSNKNDPTGLKMLSFSLDKDAYEIGEKATAIIPAAAGGRALVSLENGSTVLKQEWIEIAQESDTKYTFTVTEEMAPNVYLHISLLQPHAQTINDLPIRMYGVMPVYVSNKQTILHPVIEMPNVLRPESDFKVTVKERSGKPMTYTLAIVDDGLLDLTSFKTPDPWNEFYAKEALGIRTWDMYDDVIGAFTGKLTSLFSTGGDAELNPANAKANRFKPVVKFIGPFTIGAGKQQTHTLRLPMYVGSVRAMVIAGQDGAYGSAEKSAYVRTPLMLLSTLPRVLSVNEDITVPVNVFAMEKDVQHVKVSIQADGATRVIGSNQQEITFKQTGDQLVSFHLKTGNQTGKATIHLTANSGGHNTKETVEIDVRNPNPTVTIRQDQWIQKGESTTLEYGLSNNLISSNAQLEVSRIPSLDFSRRFNFLYNYQHHCTEQLTSKALPLLFISQFKEVDKEESQSIKENVETAIQQLYARQLSNGGFAYWPGDAVANEWITSYVGVFLALAQEKGYAVHGNVLKKWKHFQRSAAQNWRMPQDTAYNITNEAQMQQAFRLYALATANAPEYGAMNRLYEQKNLSKAAAFRLAAAYALTGKSKNAEELVFRSRLNSSDDGHYSNYGSAIREEAMLLETYILLNRHDVASVLARNISNSLKAEDNFDTQSTAFSLMAMGQLAEKLSGSLHFGWQLNGKAQKDIQSAKAMFVQDLTTTDQGQVTLSNKGDGALNVAIVSSAQLLHDTLPEINNQISLQVVYKDMNGRPLNLDQIPQGSDFVATITVTNNNPAAEYADLALTHILPSGWEIYESVIGKVAYTYQDIRDDRLLTYFDLHRGEKKSFSVRLQATYLGDFILPAIQCEGMYDTSVLARTKAGKTKVVHY